MRRLPHIVFLALWVLAAGATVRIMAAERQYQSSIVHNDDPKRHEAALKRAVELNPVHGYALAAQGRLHAARGRHALGQPVPAAKGKAIEEFSLAANFTEDALRYRFSLEMTKQFASAYHQMGIGSYYLEPYDSRAKGFKEQSLKVALEHYAKALKYLPNDKELLYRSAFAFSPGFLDQPKISRQFAERYLRFHPPTPEIYYVLTQALQELERDRRGMHCQHRFVLMGKGDVLPQPILDYNWNKHMAPWIALIRKVETGEIKAADPEHLGRDAL